MTKDESVKNSDLGRLVASRRKAQGRSARDVAREAKIDIHTMMKLESGGYESPRPHTLRGISNALNIPLLQLFRAAGYVTPQDLVEMVRNFQPEPALVNDDAPAFDEAKNRHIEHLIETYGLDYIGPEYKALNSDHD